MTIGNHAYYVGCDVSDQETALCVINGDGDIVKEAMVSSDFAAIHAYLQSTGLTFERIGLEASSLSI